MRVLAHIHTLNDQAVIDQIMEGLQRQTRPLDGVILVDNGSKDETLNRSFAENVTVVRNTKNLGTSGAIVQGLAHALEHGYDWAWLFDADSVPEPDALENLLAFFETLPPAEQEQVCFLACQLRNAEGEVRHRPMTFKNSKLVYEEIEADTAATKCDCFIWTGALFRMPAVAKIGLPSADYVLDMGEIEYGYRARKLGFVSYLVHNATNNQDVGRNPGVVVQRSWKIGRYKIAFREVSAIRTYYICRNSLYFWIYQCRPLHAGQVAHSLANTLVFVATLALRPISHRRQLIASLRGVWDGLTAQQERRY